MRFATVRVPGGTSAARVDGNELVLLEAPDVGALLTAGPLTDRAVVPETGQRVQLADAQLATLVPRPAKVLCVGLNYRSHLLELGFSEPAYPTLFAKFASSLIGPHDDLVVPSITEALDWEVELTVVIGRPVFRVGEAEAAAAIGGYTVANDITMRDWQRRTKEWLQGKAVDGTTPVGPVLVTPDELDGATDLQVTCEVDGEVVQQGNTADLLFSPAFLVSYISTFASLAPGDLVLTGTPGGVGAVSGRRLLPGSTIRTAIEGIGECVNHTVADPH